MQNEVSLNRKRNNSFASGLFVSTFVEIGRLEKSSLEFRSIISVKNHLPHLLAMGLFDKCVLARKQLYFCENRLPSVLPRISGRAHRNFCLVLKQHKKIFDVSPIGFFRNVTDKTGRGGGYLYMLGGRV